MMFFEIYKMNSIPESGVESIKSQHCRRRIPRWSINPTSFVELAGNTLPEKLTRNAYELVEKIIVR